MAGEKVDTPDSTVHLGIFRNTSQKADIEGKITKENYLFLDGCGASWGGGGKWVQGHSGRVHMVNFCHSTISLWAGGPTPYK